MVSSLTDGTSAVTDYSYEYPCSTGQCVGVGDPQYTTITYPAQALCPGTSSGCAAGTLTKPTEIDQYSAGLETSSELSAPSNANESETWSYAWDLGNGTANTTEVISYPDTLDHANSVDSTPPTATIISDPAGNVVSTTNVLGDVATSAYNDTSNGSNIGYNLNELLWSFPGPSSNAPGDAPAGSWAYTYNAYGQVLTATSPLSTSTNPQVTSYGYYVSDYSLLSLSRRRRSRRPGRRVRPTVPARRPAAVRTPLCPLCPRGHLVERRPSRTTSRGTSRPRPSTRATRRPCPTLRPPPPTTTSWATNFGRFPRPVRAARSPERNPYATVMTYEPGTSYVASKTRPDSRLQIIPTTPRVIRFPQTMGSQP